MMLILVQNITITFTNNIKSLEEYNNILNLVNDDGRDYFKFSLNDEIGKKTIEVFNLNHTLLTNRRSDLQKLIINMRSGGLDDDGIKLALEKSGFYSYTITF